MARPHFLCVVPRNFDESFPLPVPRGLWYPYVAMALAPNDCFCGEQLNGDWELKFETSKSGSLIVPGDWGRVSGGLLVIRIPKDDS